MLDELISNRYSLDQINEAIVDTKAGKSRRNVIIFDWSIRARYRGLVAPDTVELNIVIDS